MGHGKLHGLGSKVIHVNMRSDN